MIRSLLRKWLVPELPEHAPNDSIPELLGNNVRQHIHPFAENDPFNEAIKYVAVRKAENGWMVILRVFDDGSGIPPLFNNHAGKLPCYKERVVLVQDGEDLLGAISTLLVLEKMK